MLSDWPFQGTIFEVPIERDSQSALFRDVIGLTEDEKYFLRGLMALCFSSKHRKTDQVGISDYLKKNGKKNSLSLIKHRAHSLLELDVFEKYEQPRPNKRPAVIYRMRDIGEMIESEKLSKREKELNSESTTPIVYQSLDVDDPISVINANDNYQHSYSRKITHLILRRCSRREEHLGKKVAIPLPGYQESVEVIQRTITGVPPMDGREDRLQQTLLTMFKEHLAEVKMKYPQLSVSDIKNEWIIDLRGCLKSMGLSNSSGNMIVQAKRLFQLRYNTFEIYFNPEGKAAQQFNLLESDTEKTAPNVYMNEDEKQLHNISFDRIDTSFLSELQPLVDEVVWSANNQQMELVDFETDKYVKPNNENHVYTVDDMIRNREGKVYRFYKVSFNNALFKECLNDAMGQIHKQPPTLLSEDRVAVRQLVYLAQRIFGKKRNDPFETTWGAIAEEIQPVEESQKGVFQAIEGVFKTEYKTNNKENEWSAGNDPVVELHGYCFMTQIPKGKARKRSSWKMKIWRNKNHDYVGDDGPAARARLRDLMKTA